MARNARHRLTYFHPRGEGARTVQKAPAWVRALSSVQCQTQRDPRDAALARADALREAALSLSLGDGVPFSGREYRLLEQLWRINI
jgi:hypothetical protein